MGQETPELSKDRLFDPVRPGLMYIDGVWTPGSEGQVRTVINPATEEVIATVAEGTAEDAARAIRAARRAFDEDGWGTSKARDRAALLMHIAQELEQHAD